jgi:hypothetical protein
VRRRRRRRSQVGIDLTGLAGSIVEESNLSVQVAALRKALGPGLGEQDWIGTVPHAGYRLIRVGAGYGAADATLPAEPTLTVLPFANLGGES